VPAWRDDAAQCAAVLCSGLRWLLSDLDGRENAWMLDRQVCEGAQVAWEVGCYDAVL
jgi:hypothetical protein